MTPGAAAADDAFSIGSRPVWFVTGGVSTGGTIALDTRGVFVGGELSVARVRDRGFVGLYADGYYDFGVDGTYLTFGPELGFIRRSRTMPLSFGADGGAAFRFSGDTELGGAVRAYVTVAGIFSVYARYMHFGSGQDDRVVQLGLALKFPLVSPFGAGTR